MTLKTMLLFRAAMTKSGEKGKLTGTQNKSTLEPTKLDVKPRKS